MKSFIIVILLFVPFYLFTQNPVICDCIAPDTGQGTTNYPIPCLYSSETEMMEIINGLPAGTTIQIAPLMFDLLHSVNSPQPGGTLGGEKQNFTAQLTMQMTGTGSLSGFSRTITIPISAEWHSAPRIPLDPVQSFDTEAYSMQGEIFGDPDFDQLSLRAGPFHGLPSPGHTTLTRLGNGDFHVDSFFDITYEIDFVGAPGSVLEGFTGTTQATVRFDSRGPDGTCGACCVPTGDCLEVSQNECSNIGGNYEGNNIACVDGLCPQPLDCPPMLFVDKSNSGLIIKSPDGNCFLISVENDGTITSTKVICP